MARHGKMEKHQSKSSERVSRLMRLHPSTFRILMACLAAALVLLLPSPAAAQTSICDTDFLPGNWQLKAFSCPAGNNVTASQQSSGGSTSPLPNPQPPAACPLNGNYRDVTTILNVAGTGGPNCPSESIAWGVHIFSGPGSTYDPRVSGAVASVGFQIDYRCPGSEPSGCQLAGQGFGPALLQGGKYFIANVPSHVTGVTPAWARLSTPPLQVTDFHEISETGSGSTQVINFAGGPPDFSATAAPIQCGFYTYNATAAAVYSQRAGYDNWACTVIPMGTLKVCKVAGPGITVGTPFGFTANGNPFQVPAGPAPGGTCVVVNPGFPVGTTVNIVEAIPAGIAVSNIAVAVAPPGTVVSTNSATGTVVVTTGPGVTAVTYTDYKTTGYLEICKSGAAGGSFMVGNLGPFTVPVGACSPAIQVAAGQVTITETPPPGTVIGGCTTIPSGRLVSCPPGGQTATVTVVPGDIPSETIVTINNRRIGTPANPQ